MPPKSSCRASHYFNSQPREGGWKTGCHDKGVCAISTHSRAKAAGHFRPQQTFDCYIFQLTAARRRLVVGKRFAAQESMISTHSRAKAAGRFLSRRKRHQQFQLTAARRRLDPQQALISTFQAISTHSRAKAAGSSNASLSIWLMISTHSRAKAAGR